MMCKVLGHTEEQRQTVWGARQIFRKLHRAMDKEGRRGSDG